jgi:hypothetical protein
MQAARGYIYLGPADVSQCCAGQQVSQAGIENRPAFHTGLRAYHLYQKILYFYKNFEQNAKEWVIMNKD